MQSPPIHSERRSTLCPFSRKWRKEPLPCIMRQVFLLRTRCTYPATVKCNTCNGSGHISPSCGKRQSANDAQLPAASSPSLLPSTQLAIGYDGPSYSSSASSSAVPPADGAASAWGTQSISLRAGIFYAPSSRPTPEIPL